MAAIASSTTYQGAGATLNKPSGTTSGDLLIAVIGDTSNFTSSWSTVPSGWTQLQNTANNDDSNGGSGFTTFYKVAGGSEPSSYTWTKTGFGSNSSGASIMLRIPGSTAAPYTSSGLADNTSDTTANGTQITPSTASSLLIMALGCGNPSGTTNFSNYAIPTSNPTWTEYYDQGFSVGNLAIAYAVRVQTTATGAPSATIADARKTNLHFMAMAYTPVPDGPVNLKSLDGNVKSNIKSYNGNVIANIKSIDGNS